MEKKTNHIVYYNFFSSYKAGPTVYKITKKKKKKNCKLKKKRKSKKLDTLL